MPDFFQQPGEVPPSEFFRDEDIHEHPGYDRRHSPPPHEQTQAGPKGAPDAPKPVEDASTGNAFRPTTFEDIIGQEQAVGLLREMVTNSQARGRVLGHVLLVGPAGTGKSTLAYVIARTLGTNCYQLEAPVSHDTLIQLQRVMRKGDVLFLDEIHQQSLGDRRGRSAATQPEVLFAVMEDQRLPTATGVLEFPEITVIGATTDEGMLPDAFIDRFPIRPALRKYTEDEMTQVAEYTADQLDVLIHYGAALRFARASRGVPRVVQSYVRNAAELTDGVIDEAVAYRVLNDLMGVTPDGLTRDMQSMLRFLYLRCERWVRGEVRYQASVSHVATGIGKSRDSKAIALRVEPYLIERGYVEVAHGGRRLTDQGVLRAISLTTVNDETGVA